MEQYKYFTGIVFSQNTRAYFFGTNLETIKEGDKVIVETVRGVELGEVSIAPIEIEKYKNGLELKPILRIATETDLKLFSNNQKDAQIAFKVCEQEIKNLALDMRLISCEYTLDKAKIIFTYLADERVDFRELLKVLAAKLHTRIDLRQVNTRDKAKMVGGIGMCGRQLCCSSFLNEFEGISINRAKNQMLAINIPKLSGHCGKLMCCLKYEDDCYTEGKTKYPNLGSPVYINNVQYKLTGINIISDTVKLENEEGILNLTYDEFKKQAKIPHQKHKNEKK